MRRAERQIMGATLRDRILRLVAMIALATPAAAVAAEPAADVDPSAEAAGLKSGPREPILERIEDPFEAARAERRQRAKQRAKRRARERAQGPFHPVATAVDYGSAEAAFGNARGRPHEGQDIFAPSGTPVVAPSDGIVLEGGSDGGRGNWVAIYDPEAKQTYNYFHLVEPAAVGAGEKVEPGEKVGRVGCTGSCSGDHLHFEVREGRSPYGTAIDPMPMLEKWSQLKS